MREFLLRLSLRPLSTDPDNRQDQVDFSLLTHIFVCRILTTSGGVLTRFDIDNTNGPIMARNLSWHSSALLDNQPNHPSAIASSAQTYRNVGVPAAKLGIGIGFYGTCWRGAGTIWRRCRT